MYKWKAIRTVLLFGQPRGTDINAEHAWVICSIISITEHMIRAVEYIVWEVLLIVYYI